MSDGFRATSAFIRPAKDKDGKFSVPALTPDGDTVYIVNKQKVLRIIAAADTFIRFGEDKATLAAEAVTAANGILIKAGEIVQVSSDEFSFMKASAALEQVLPLQDRG